MKKLFTFMILFTMCCLQVKVAEAFDFGAPPGFGSTFDPSQQYPGVYFLSGPVEQDSDWNSGGIWGNTPMFGAGMGWGFPNAPTAPWSGGPVGPNFQGSPYFQNSLWGSPFPQGSGSPLNSWGGFTSLWPMGTPDYSFGRIADFSPYAPDLGSSYFLPLSRSSDTYSGSNWGTFTNLGYQNFDTAPQFRTMSFPRWNYEDMMDEDGHPVYRGAHSTWW